MKVVLGWPGWWQLGELYEDSGLLPVHLYPFPVTADGQGPADPDERDHDICWCGWDDCTGVTDELGFPAK